MTLTGEHIEALKPKQGITESDEIEQTDSGARPRIHNNSLGHALSASEKAITSLCSAGPFLGAIIADLTADKYGRKGPMYVGFALFTVEAILQAPGYSVPQMAVGRLTVGLGVGSAAMIVPAYIAEIAPMKYRGHMVGLNNVSITGGQVISYAIGAAFASVPHGWRYMGRSRWDIVKELNRNPAHFRALVCACRLMAISQMSGFNV
ncbi:hypothetical protein AFLA_009756 [Aspergillus flavus NRRL3357]|nr:hypothetical protein AFLA_009756 [Aspergillus flavus NRRL3357]